jgi:TolB protein
VDRDGGNERKLIDLFAGEYYRVGFDWSPDGSKLVYSDRIDGAGSFDLYVIDVETLETTKITSDESTDEEEPDWSPTSDEIVYHQGPKDDSVPRDDYDVYKVNSDGSNPTQLTTNEWADYSPMWSPDGSAIAFFSTRDDYHSESGPYLWELYIMQPDGGADRRLTEQATRKSNPAWSPDGDSIAYNSRCDDDVCGNDYDDNIYVVDVSSERLRKVTTKGQRSEDQPTWSPDSSWIAYVLHQRGGRSSDLFAVKVRNKRVKRVTSTRASGEGQIQWSSGRPGGTDL